MPKRLLFPFVSFVVLGLATVWSTPAVAAWCNSMFCSGPSTCSYQINGPGTWCYSAPGMCMWSGDCDVPE
jgi:hypothetical protein